jgi:hypothetical protein
MSENNHDVKNEGANPTDYELPCHHSWKHIHQDCRVQIAVVVMLAMMLVYIVWDNLSLRPGKHPIQSSPKAIS